MSAWTKAELDRIGRAEEIDVAPVGSDGALRSFVTVWVVRHADEVYVRSAVRGRAAAWFRGVHETHQGRVRVGRTEKEVEFVDADHGLDDPIDKAYRAKYGKYGPRILNSCLTPEARSTTLRLVPRA